MTYPLLSIREMTEQFNVTARALRFYESKELLFPIRKGQRRLYTYKDKARLRLILRAKRFGFSLEQIAQMQEIFAGPEYQKDRAELILKMAQDQLEVLEEKKADLDVSISELKEEIDSGLSVLESCHTRLKAA